MTPEQIEQQAKAKWGWWRKFIAKNPLTGFWVGVGLGATVIGGIVKALVPGI